MGVPDGAHTHGHGGGSGLGTAVLVLIGAALAVKVLPVAVAAVGELVRLVLIVVAVLAGLAAAGGAAYVALRLRHRATEPARRVYQAHPVAQRRPQALPEPRPSAAALPPADRHELEAPRQLHIHVHGVSAEDVAAIIRQQQEDQ